MAGTASSYDAGESNRMWHALGTFAGTVAIKLRQISSTKRCGGVRLEGRRLMARVWFVREGSEPIRNVPVAEMPIGELERRFGLQRDDYRAPPSDQYIIGDSSTPNDGLPRFVVVGMTEEEATGSEWKPGFYLLRIAIGDAQALLVDG